MNSPSSIGATVQPSFRRWTADATLAIGTGCFMEMGQAVALVWLMSASRSQPFDSVPALNRVAYLADDTRHHQKQLAQRFTRATAGRGQPDVAADDGRCATCHAAREHHRIRSNLKGELRFSTSAGHRKTLEKPLDLQEHRPALVDRRSIPALSSEPFVREDSSEHRWRVAGGVVRRHAFNFGLADPSHPRA